MGNSPILVYYDGTDCADDLLLLAAHTSSPNRHLVVLTVNEIPPSLPLYQLGPDVGTSTRAALRSARRTARRAGIQADFELIRGRDTAQVIVRRAGEIGARAIFLPVTENAVHRFFGRMPRLARAVLADAPCPVYIASGHGGKPVQAGSLRDKRVSL